MINPILGFSGPIASGKTVISTELSRRTGWEIVSFGNYIREYAKSQGLNPNSREVLQQLGKQLINSGWYTFCSNVLISSSWHSGEGLIIYGIRHVEGMQTIKKIVEPQPFFLIYVTISDHLRKARFEQRNLTIDQVKDFEKDSTEQEVISSLLNYSSLIVDGAGSLELIMVKILNWLNDQNFSASKSL
jgi:dephospho-CoA kinase